MSYPGNYQPSFSKRPHRNREPNGASIPAWEVLYHPGSIQLRCWIPGARREDIELTIRNHRLYLSVHSSIPQPADGSYASIRYQLELPLPDRADTSWYAAEFHRGLLTLEFPHASPCFVNGESKVVVY